MLAFRGVVALLKKGYHRFLGASKSFDMLEIFGIVIMIGATGWQTSAVNLPVLFNPWLYGRVEKY
jgi:hypothetical protein